MYSLSSKEVNDIIGSDKAMPAIIVGLDRVLARLKDRSPYNASECEYDALNHVVYRLVKKYQKDDYKIIIITSRENIYWPETERWLNKYNIKPDIIIMRPEEDCHLDFSFKHRAYNQYIKNKYDIELVLEYHSQAVNMWRSIGLTCFQVDSDSFYQ